MKIKVEIKESKITPTSFPKLMANEFGTIFLMQNEGGGTCVGSPNMGAFSVGEHQECGLEEFVLRDFIGTVTLSNG